MSEKPKRSSKEIEQEYASLCARAGDLQYKADAFARDLRILNDTIRELNFEHAAAKQAEAEAAKAESSANPTS